MATQPTTVLTSRLAAARLVATAYDEHHACGSSESRLLRAVDNLRGRGQLSAEDWWTARLVIVGSTKGRQ
jgi:hypothetical protein